MVKLGEMSEKPGKGGKMDAEISAAAGTLFTVAAVAAVLSFGGGPAGAGSAAHQQAPVSGAAGGTGAGALLSLPHKGLVVQGTRVQLVCGLHAAQLRHALEQQLAEMAPV